MISAAAEVAAPVRPHPQRQNSSWPPNSRAWEQWEMDLLVELRTAHKKPASSQQIADVLGRSRVSVNAKADRMGLTVDRDYTPAQLEQAAALRRLGWPWKRIVRKLGHKHANNLSKSVRRAYPELKGRRVKKEKDEVRK